jgi:molecular chaperone DnaK
MSKIVGIDLGTTNSLVATVDSGIPVGHRGRQGQRLTPSVVHFPGPAHRRSSACGQSHARPAARQTVYSIKRFMGRRGSEISAARKCRSAIPSGPKAR